MWRRATVLAVLCAALAALASSDTLHEALLQVLAASEQTIAERPLLGALLFIILAALSAMFVFVSAAVVSPVAVFTWGEAVSILLLWTGWMVGGALSYGIGRLIGRPTIHWLTGRAPMRGLERRIRRNASFGLVLLFQLALPSEIPGYVLGSLRYPFWTYLLALALAELPYTIATIYLGAGFIERRTGLLLGLGAMVITLAISASYWLTKHFKTSLRAGESS